jgi:hypothetical protein
MLFVAFNPDQGFFRSLLKPDKICGIYGTAKAVPFQSNEFFRSLLKPDKICGIYGTAEAVPFQSPSTLIGELL